MNEKYLKPSIHISWLQVGKGKSQICEVIRPLSSHNPHKEQEGKQRKLSLKQYEEATSALWLGSKQLTSLGHNCFICIAESLGLVSLGWDPRLWAPLRPCPSHLITRFACKRSTACLYQGRNNNEVPLSFKSWSWPFSQPPALSNEPSYSFSEQSR